MFVKKSTNHKLALFSVLFGPTQGCLFLLFASRPDCNFFKLYPRQRVGLLSETLILKHEASSVGGNMHNEREGGKKNHFTLLIQRCSLFPRTGAQTFFRHHSRMFVLHAKQDRLTSLLIFLRNQCRAYPNGGHIACTASQVRCRRHCIHFVTYPSFS